METPAAHPNTKAGFLAAYETELVSRYPWAKAFPDKRARFMEGAKNTIETPEGEIPVTAWNHHGDAVAAAWKAIGNKGRPTLKALRALP